MFLGTFSNESFHSDGDVSGRNRLGRTALFAPKYKPLPPFIFRRQLVEFFKKMNKFKDWDTTLWTKSLFHCTTLSFKKSRLRLSIVRCFRSRKHEFSSQLTAKPSFELKRQTFLALQMRYIFPQWLQTDKHLWWFGGTAGVCCCGKQVVCVWSYVLCCVMQ